MGAVFEVQDPRSNRRLALKLIKEDMATPSARERFSREAAVLARINHRSVVRVHDLGRARQGPYLLQELIEGEDLKSRALRQPFSPHEAATVLRHLADAVETVHSYGILHRDLKPGNAILRPDGIPVLLDFGLARDANAETLTATGTMLGTPAYLAPEQAEGQTRDLTPAADVYGLGGVLFFLLAERDPFVGASVINLINQVLNQEPRWPSEDHPDVPWELEAICRLAMAKDVAQRYPTAAALRDDLDRYLAGQPTEAGQRFPRQSGMRTLRLAIAGIVLLLLLGGVDVVANVLGSGPPAEPSTEPPAGTEQDEVEGQSATPTPEPLPPDLPLAPTDPPQRTLPARVLGRNGECRVDWIDDERLLLAVSGKAMHRSQLGGEKKVLPEIKGRNLLGLSRDRATAYVRKQAIRVKSFQLLRLDDAEPQGDVKIAEMYDIRSVASHREASRMIFAVGGRLPPSDRRKPGRGALFLVDAQGQQIAHVAVSEGNSVGHVAFSDDGRYVGAGTIQMGSEPVGPHVAALYAYEGADLIEVANQTDRLAMTCLGFAPGTHDLLVGTHGGAIILLRPNQDSEFLDGQVMANLQPGTKAHAQPVGRPPPRIPQRQTRLPGQRRWRGSRLEHARLEANRPVRRLARDPRRRSQPRRQPPGAGPERRPYRGAFPPALSSETDTRSLFVRRSSRTFREGPPRCLQGFIPSGAGRERLPVQNDSSSGGSR
jgi:serine/threonine protein kinase